MKIGQVGLLHPPIAPPSMSRRTFLQAGGSIGALLYLFGLDTVNSLAALKKPLYPKLFGLDIPNEIVQASEPIPTILIWCDGGLSQWESFDPNPKAKVEYRGHFGVTSTSTAGLVISENFPEMAKVIDKVLLNRGVYSTGIPEHFEQTIHTITCSHEIGSNDIPMHPSMIGRLATEVLRPKREIDIPVINSSAGSKPYDVMEPQGTISIKFTDNPCGFISPFGESIDENELDLRIKLGRQLGINLSAPKAREYDANFNSARNTLNNKGLTQAFDLSKVDPDLRKEFGQTPIGNALITALLLARAGVKFTIIHHGYFDDHYDYISETKGRMPPFDKALSALVRRAEQEGVLVALGTEFGRTPKLNGGKPPKDAPGRDHWIKGYSVAFFGKGINGGILGATDKDGFASKDECHSSGFIPTVLKLGGYELRWKEGKKPFPTWPIV